MNTVMFVHGLGGTATGTWGKFPELLKADDELKEHWQAQFFEYPTSILNFRLWRRGPKVQTIAAALDTEINARCGDGKVVLVCHSLGGVVARRYLVDTYEADRPRVSDALLYSTPNDGAGLAQAGKFISFRNWHIRQLCKSSDLLRDLNASWDNMKLAESVRTVCVVGGVDNVVSEESARGRWGNTNVKVVIQAGHRDIVKPADHSDLRYLILRDFLREALAPNRPGGLLKLEFQPAFSTKGGSFLAVKNHGPQLTLRAQATIVETGGWDAMFNGMTYALGWNAHKDRDIVLGPGEEAFLDIASEGQTPSGKIMNLHRVRNTGSWEMPISSEAYSTNSPSAVLLVDLMNEGTKSSTRIRVDPEGVSLVS